MQVSPSHNVVAIDQSLFSSNISNTFLKPVAVITFGASEFHKIMLCSKQLDYYLGIYFFMMHLKS